MRSTDQTQTMVQVDADAGVMLGAPNGGFFPVALFVERGGDLAQVAPYQRFASSLDALDALAKELDQECRRRILLIADEDKQRNMLARASELVLAHSMGVLTDAEALEMAQLQGLWTRIKALRAACNSLQAALPALSLDQLNSYEPAAQAWPE